MDWGAAMGAVGSTLGRPRNTFAAFVIALVLYVAAPRLGLPKWALALRPYAGLAAIVLGPLCFLQCVYGGWDSIRKEQALKKRREEALRALDSLSREEILLLLFCYSGGQRTIVLSYGDPAAHSLCNKGLLKPGSGHTWSFPFELPEFVWEHLHTERRDQMEALLAREDIQDALPRFPRRSLM